MLKEKHFLALFRVINVSKTQQMQKKYFFFFWTRNMIKMDGLQRIMVLFIWKVNNFIKLLPGD
jgi:hypothetical protein